MIDRQESIEQRTLQDTLYRELHFIADDVTANQHGYITTVQVARLIAESKSYRRNAWRLLAIYYGAAAVIISAVVLIADRSPYVFVSLILVWVFLFLAILAIAVIAAFIAGIFRQKLLRHLQEHIFEEVRGELRVYCIGDKTWRVSRPYILSVGDRGFWITRQQYERLRDSVPLGQHAIAYHVPLAQWMILSLVLV